MSLSLQSSDKTSVALIKLCASLKFSLQNSKKCIYKFELDLIRKIDLEHDASKKKKYLELIKALYNFLAFYDTKPYITKCIMLNIDNTDVLKLLVNYLEIYNRFVIHSLDTRSQKDYRRMTLQDLVNLIQMNYDNDIRVISMINSYANIYDL